MKTVIAQVPDIPHAGPAQVCDLLCSRPGGGFGSLASADYRPFAQADYQEVIQHKNRPFDDAKRPKHFA